MLHAFHDQGFRRSFLIALAVLTGLTFFCYRIAWYDVIEADVAGVYHRTSVPFLKTDSLPAQVLLHADHRMELFMANGDRLFTGHWHWEGEERIVRVDDARWDRQIRMRSTLMGPRLCMRISALPFAIDEPEHDEEVDLVKE